jgi:hypothetical protein
MCFADIHNKLTFLLKTFEALLKNTLQLRNKSSKLEIILINGSNYLVFLYVGLNLEILATNIVLGFNHSWQV